VILEVLDDAVDLNGSDLSFHLINIEIVLILFECSSNTSDARGLSELCSHVFWGTDITFRGMADYLRKQISWGFDTEQSDEVILSAVEVLPHKFFGSDTHSLVPLVADPFEGVVV